MLEFAIRGNSGSVRDSVFERDGGRCAKCGKTAKWEAHHVIAVEHGGGCCGLENYITLCIPCHKQERKNR